MPILSIEFFIFFVIFFPLYWLFKTLPKWQNGLLLISSLGWLYYINYSFFGVVILFSLTIYGLASKITQSKSEKVKKNYTILGICLVILNLCVFKYYDFFIESFRPFFNTNLIEILLPLGISYYSFQSISYLISLYKNRVEKLNFIDNLLYFSFFLTITAGPIARLEQIKNKKSIYPGMQQQLTTEQPRNLINPALAITLIFLGIAKKWTLSGGLADNFVTPIFENPSQYDFFSLLVGIYGYTFQLYFDFSGYTDIVIGFAMLLGFQLPQNFNMPLRAFNLVEFWNRWHISLSTWIRDYIYIPLGGSRKTFIRTQLNVFIAMLLSGIWHGYGFTFLIWGAIHGIGLVITNIFSAWCKKPLFSQSYWSRIIGVFFTFNFVAFAFLIFRANSMNEAKELFQSLIDKAEWGMTIDLNSLIILISFLLFILFQASVQKLINAFVVSLNKLNPLLWVIPMILLFLIILVISPSGIPNFIYANF